jgi:hypothetical protein
MNFTLPNPTGIDYWLQKFQLRLYDYLKTTWNVDDASYNCFGRVYRNNTKDGYVPEFYDPTQQCYVSSGGANTSGGLYWQDNLAAMSFFGLAESDKVVSGQTEARIQLMFFVNLDKITPAGITNAQGQRLDEVAINDIQNFIQLNGCGLVVTARYKDVDKVLERYSGEVKKDALKRDMHPNFCFRIDATLHYNTNLNK